MIPDIPRWSRVVVGISIPVAMTMVISLAISIERHDYSQILSLVIGLIVAAGCLSFVGKVLRDHERLQRDLKKANNALRRSEIVKQDMFQRAVTGISMVDKSLCVIDVNESFAHALGYRCDDMIGRHIFDYMHPEDRHDMKQKRDEMLNGKVSSSTRDMRLRRSDGEYRWFSMSTSVVYDNDGLPSFFLNQAIDIHESHEMQNALIEQRYMHERLLEALSSMGECVTISEGESIVWANEAYADLTGYSIDELAGKAASDLVVDAGEMHSLRRKRADLDTGQAESIEFSARLIRKDGEIVHVEGATHRITTGGRSQRVSIFRDVSYRVLWEKAITDRSSDLHAANEELREANKLKTDLFGMLSHEIGQPLTAIVGYAELLNDDWTGLDEEFKQTAIDRINAASHQLTTLVDEMISMTRAGTDELHATLETVNLRKEARRQNR